MDAIETFLDSVEAKNKPAMNGLAQKIRIGWAETSPDYSALEELLWDLFIEIRKMKDGRLQREFKEASTLLKKAERAAEEKALNKMYGGLEELSQSLKSVCIELNNGVSLHEVYRDYGSLGDKAQKLFAEMARIPC